MGIESMPDLEQKSSSNIKMENSMENNQILKKLRLDPLFFLK